MRRWLRIWCGNLYYESMGFRGIEDVTFSARKPPALVYLDDRAMRFEGPGTWPSVEEIHKARPWNKK
jgi:hypothetical protein